MGQQWWPDKRTDQLRRDGPGRAWEQARRRRARARRRAGLRDLLTMAAAGVLLGLGYVQFGGGFGGPPDSVGAGVGTAPLAGSADPAVSERNAVSAAAPAPTRTRAVPAGGGVRRFTFCHVGGGRNCVVDGDTFWMDGEKIRVADIDAPETHPSRCPREAELGARATQRLHALLNAGPISLGSADRDTDRYGRKLRIVSRDGDSLGAVLVAEGLARQWGGARRSWCD